MSWDSKTEKVLDVCMDTFGVGPNGHFIYVPKNGHQYQVRGIFDDAHIAVDPDTEAVVSSTAPILGIKLSDLPINPRLGDKVIVRDVTYMIVDVQKDVHGGANLILQKA